MVTNKIALEEVNIRPASELENWIYADDESPWFDLNLDAQRNLRQKAIEESVRYHIERCESYRTFVTSEAPELLSYDGKESLELERVPLIPTSAFKRVPLLSVKTEEIAKRCLSSGTRGPRSEVLRDRTSLERLLGSVRSGTLLIDNWYEHQLSMINLGPDSSEAGDIWYAYVMSLVEVLYDTTSVVQDGNFDPQDTAEEVLAQLDESPQLGIIGPPFFLLELLQSMKQRGQLVDGGDRVTIVTAGGWKRHSGDRIPRDELTDLAVEVLGLQRPSQVRDAFNQVELNTVFFECDALKKHVPPWVHAMTRAPDTLEALPPGELGLLSYLDASCTAYPAFIIGDDIGRVFEGRCECGRDGVTMDVKRRVEGRIQKGCALTMDKRFSRGDKHANG